MNLLLSGAKDRNQENYFEFKQTYELVLDYLTSILTPIEFINLIPDSGYLPFFLEYIQKCSSKLKLKNGLSVMLSSIDSF